MTSNSRRSVLKGAAALAGASALGLPMIARAQSDKIRIGHLTPLTGFLGALGEYAVLGLRIAEEEINKAGGVMGRQLEIISEDSVNPATAATKAQRMLERDGALLLMGEISSASALTISQVAARNQRLFMSIGARSDVLRGKNCNKFTFHMDIPNTVMVNAVGKALLRDNMVKGKKFFSLTADYVFGHDLLRAAKAFFAANNGNLIGDELVATDVTDFSPYLLKIRQASPDVVCSNLAGNQVTNLIKQYAEFGLPYPIVGFNLNTADAWAAGENNLSGTWPTVWHHDLDVPALAGLRVHLHQEARQAAGEPCLDRVHHAEDAGAGDVGDQVDRQRDAGRFLREAGGDGHPQGAQGLVPRLGPSAHAGGLSVHREGQGTGKGQVGLPGSRGRRSGRQRISRGAGSDPRAEPLPDVAARAMPAAWPSLSAPRE